MFLPSLLNEHEIGGLLNKGSSSRDAKWGTIGRKSVSYFNEYTETHLSTIPRQPIFPYQLAVSDFSTLHSRKGGKMKRSHFSLTGTLILFAPCSLLRKI